MQYVDKRTGITVTTNDCAGIEFVHLMMKFEKQYAIKENNLKKQIPLLGLAMAHVNCGWIDRKDGKPYRIFPAYPLYEASKICLGDFIGIYEDHTIDLYQITTIDEHKFFTITYYHLEPIEKTYYIDEEGWLYSPYKPSKLWLYYYKLKDMIFG